MHADQLSLYQLLTLHYHILVCIMLTYHGYNNAHKNVGVHYTQQNMVYYMYQFISYIPYKNIIFMKLCTPTRHKIILGLCTTPIVEKTSSNLIVSQIYSTQQILNELITIYEVIVYCTYNAYIHYLYVLYNKL